MYKRQPKKRIEQLVTQIGEIRNKIQGLETVLQQHQYNLHVIQDYISAKDHATESDEHKFHVCPNCGYIFDEEIFSLVRSNYGTLNEDYICQQIRLLISATSDKLDLEKKQYVTLRQQMTEEETAFQSEKNEFDIYVRQRGLADSIRRFQQQLSKTISDIQEDEKNIKEISKELRKLPNKKEVEEKYIEYARLNIMTLDAWDPALSLIHI